MRSSFILYIGRINRRFVNTDCEESQSLSGSSRRHTVPSSGHEHQTSGHRSRITSFSSRRGQFLYFPRQKQSISSANIHLDYYNKIQTFTDPYTEQLADTKSNGIDIPSCYRSRSLTLLLLKGSKGWGLRYLRSRLTIFFLQLGVSVTLLILNFCPLPLPRGCTNYTCNLICTYKILGKTVRLSYCEAKCLPGRDRDNHPTDKSRSFDLKFNDGQNPSFRPWPFVP